ncbi:MAG: hypothetical protein IPP73_04990 [Chitinophagaceae bacterium]|nr:hypothetical protein [Chitinophagaceae bacterium]
MKKLFTYSFFLLFTGLLLSAIKPVVTNDPVTGKTALICSIKRPDIPGPDLGRFGRGKTAARQLFHGPEKQTRFAGGY